MRGIAQKIEWEKQIYRRSLNLIQQDYEFFSKNALMINFFLKKNLPGGLSLVV